MAIKPVYNLTTFKHISKPAVFYILKRSQIKSSLLKWPIPVNHVVKILYLTTVLCVRNDLDRGKKTARKSPILCYHYSLLNKQPKTVNENNKYTKKKSNRVSFKSKRCFDQNWIGRQNGKFWCTKRFRSKTFNSFLKTLELIENSLLYGAWIISYRSLF